MEEYAITLDKHITAGTVPSCDISKMAKEGYCSYCDHRDKCQAVENGKL